MKYNFLAPLQLTKNNSAGLKGLLSMQTKYQPFDITGLYEGAMVSEPDAQYEILFTDQNNKPYFETDLEGNDFQILLMKPRDPHHQNNFARWTMLYLEIQANESGEIAHTIPRQWVIGSEFRGLIPYQMSCGKCQALSGLFIFIPENSDQQLVFLIENEKFTSSDHHDIFGINRGDGGAPILNPRDGLVIDPDGEKIAHTYQHMMGHHGHDCRHDSHKTIPNNRLPAFTAFKPTG